MYRHEFSHFYTLDEKYICECLSQVVESLTQNQFCLFFVFISFTRNLSVILKVVSMRIELGFLELQFLCDRFCCIFRKKAKISVMIILVIPAKVPRYPGWCLSLQKGKVNNTIMSVCFRVITCISTCSCDCVMLKHAVQYKLGS
jgi:hypothetical protein